MARTNTLTSTLPYFRAERFPSAFHDKALFEYQCARRDCGKFFYLLDPLLPEHTAPCPHCFRVSRAPTS